jgi:hypothetical protein
MKTRLRLWVLLSAVLLFSTTNGVLAQCPQEPSFDDANFLFLPDIPELNLDFALQWTDSAAGLFLQPFDAVILHLNTEGELWDVYIFSDVGMNRLTIWVCSGNEGGRYERELFSITAYDGEDADGLSMPSGLTTNAVGRIFDPEYDLIYLADRGNDRIVELGLVPDLGKRECELFFNRSFGEGVLEWPVDITISAYSGRSDADFYVVDWGHEKNAGGLYRFDMDGDYEYDTGYIRHERTGDTLFGISHPVSVACAPDNLNGRTDIFISEASGPLIFGLASDTDNPPEFLLVQNLRIGKGFWEPGGIAIDDLGRVYIANRAAQIIENYGPKVGCYYAKIGEDWDLERKFQYPSNIIIDTYYGVCEALVIEKYFRQSGLRTFVIGNECGSATYRGGFVRNNRIASPEKSVPQIPLIFSLHNAYPNPFNSKCRIGYSLPVESRVSIEVFDALGRKVAKLLDKDMATGEHLVIFNAADLSSGTYFYKMTAGKFSQTKQIVLIK